jgi:serine/threonine-protein kinase
VSWDRDGILVGQGDRIIRVSSNGGNPEALVSARDGELLSAPQRLPEGNRLLFTVVARDAAARGDRFESSQVVAHSLTDGQRTVVVEAGSDGRYLPSGHLVYAVGGVLFAAPFNPRAPKPVTSGIPIVQGIRRANTAGQLQFSVSADGSFVYLPGSPTGSSSQLDLALLDLKGGAIPLGLQPAAFRYPRLRPTAAAWPSTPTPERRRTSGFTICLAKRRYGD